MRLTLQRVGMKFSADSWLFRDVSASFSPASIHALVGPSGSGKSTLLNITARLQAPTEGAVIWSDLAAMENLTDGQVRFSWILQSNAVIAGRTALDNAALGAICEGVPHQQARDSAVEALVLLGLGGVRNAKVGALSGGEVQRVTVARSLLSLAPVILADEPTGQLDRANTAVVFQGLVAAARRGKTVIIATHDRSIAALCDQVIDLGDPQLALR